MSLPDVKDKFDEALESVDALHKLCLNQGDVKTALQCVKERNKLYRLYAEDRQRETENIQNRELAAIREYLLPLDLTSDEETPTRELVRLLVNRVQNDQQKHRPVPKQETGLRQTKPGKLGRGKKHLPDSAGQKLAAQK